MENQEYLLEQIVKDEQLKMIQQLHFIEMFVPGPDSHAKCNVFMSSNWNTCARLLILIVSGKGIQPGIWSRSLVLESNNHYMNNPHSYRSGSM